MDDGANIRRVLRRLGLNMSLVRMSHDASLFGGDGGQRVGTQVRRVLYRDVRDYLGLVKGRMRPAVAGGCSI